MDNPQQPVVQHLTSPYSSKSQQIPLIAVGTIMLLVGLGAGYILFATKTTNTQGNQVVQILPTQTVTSPTPNLTAILKTYTENLSWFGTIDVKYPNDWKVAKSTHSGHPNFATFSSSDNTLCVNMSISSDEVTSLDGELKNGATNWDASQQDSKVVMSNTMVVNGYQAKERKVNRDKKEFMDGVIELGSDPRYKESKVYAYLSSCGLDEGEIFSSMLSNLIVTPKQ